MSEKELEICRIKYENIKNEKEKYLKLQEELDNLIKNPTVQRYLELSNLIMESKENFTQDNMIRYAFNDINGNFNTDCNIYIYLKTYRYVNNIKLLQDARMPVLHPFCYLEVYSDYMNVETGKIMKVSFIKRDEFERNNIVILPPDNIEIDDYTQNAENIRLWYLNQLLVDSQKDVILKLVNPQTTNKFYE